MHIIITGGSGLIGTALTKTLTAKKHTVTILSRNPEWVVGLPAGAKAVQWDGRTAAGWGDLVNSADAIVNLAGESIAGESPLSMRWSAERKERILRSRLNAGKAIVEAVTAASKKPQVLIQASAVGYYGPRADEQITEEASAGSDFLANVCKQWEASTKAVEGLNIRRAVIRIGVVLSQKGGALPLQVLPFKFFAGGPLGSGRQYYPWIHLNDVVGGIVYLIEDATASGIYNLCAPEPVTNKQLAGAIGKALSRPAFVTAPAFAFKLAFGEASTILLDGQRVIPKRLLEAGYEFQFSDVQAALSDLLQ